MNSKEFHIINNNIANYLHSKDVELHFHLGFLSNKPQYQPLTLSYIVLPSWDPIFPRLGFSLSPPPFSKLNLLELVALTSLPCHTLT